MNNLIITNNTPRNYNKDCADFRPLKDGTLLGDVRYCDLSTACRQADYCGKGYISDWYHFFDHISNEYSFDYFCTGMYGNKDERVEDKKVS